MQSQPPPPTPKQDEAEQQFQGWSYSADKIEERERLTKEMLSWLEARGCKQLERLDVRIGGIPSVCLRGGNQQRLLANDVALEVPQEAWISVPLDVEEPEQELAWQLLQERWLGDASEFAPYAAWLWCWPNLIHPIFWEEEEVDLTAPSSLIAEAVREIRETTARRVKELVSRARAPGSNAPASLLESDKAALEEEAKKALCLVEMRGIVAPHCVPPRAALIPVLDHIRSSAEGTTATVLVGQDPDQDIDTSILPVRAVVACEEETEEEKEEPPKKKGIRPGQELVVPFDETTSARLLAQYAVVPVPPDDEEVVNVSAQERYMEQAECNLCNMAEIEVTVDSKNYSEDRNIKKKVEFLAERGWDLRKGYAEPPKLHLPQDAFIGGMAFRIARFLVTPVDDLDVAFAYFFGSEHAGRPAKPYEAVALEAEADAHNLVASWCIALMEKYKPVMEKTTKIIDSAFSVINQQDPLAAGNMVSAYYKAKGPDGKVARSRKAKQATVMAVSDDEIAVKFVSNGVRQKVPASWVSVPGQESNDKRAEEMGMEEAYFRWRRAILTRDAFEAEGALLQVQFDVLEFCWRSTEKFAAVVRSGDSSQFKKAQQEFEQWQTVNILEELLKKRHPDVYAEMVQSAATMRMDEP